MSPSFILSLLSKPVLDEFCGKYNQSKINKKIKTHICFSSYVLDRYETNSSYLVAVSAFNSIVNLK